MNLSFYLILFFSFFTVVPVWSQISPSSPLSIRPVSPQMRPFDRRHVPPVAFLLKPDVQTRIILDPGHGGKDLGAHSRNPPRYQEKILTLVTARMVKDILEKMGYKVSMTRTRDVFISLEKRSEFANSHEPELFVSLHFNSAPNKQAEGIEVFYYRTDENKERVEDSKLLAHNILNRMIKNTSAKSRGIKHGNLSVIRETTMPAVLVEAGFLTHETEVHKLKDAEYLKKVSQGIAQGIHDYIIRRKR